MRYDLYGCLSFIKTSINKIIFTCFQLHFCNKTVFHVNKNLLFVSAWNKVVIKEKFESASSSIGIIFCFGKNFSC